MWRCFGNNVERQRGREIWNKGGMEEEWSGVRLALMMGAPRATQVQLSPLPTSAMSDQHNKKQCVSMCSHEQLGGLEKRERKKKVNKGEESCASPNLLLCLELVEFLEQIPVMISETMVVRLS